jgi:hypothetical protein
MRARIIPRPHRRARSAAPAALLSLSLSLGMTSRRPLSLPMLRPALALRTRSARPTTAITAVTALRVMAMSTAM